jgi:hypothetical protein
MLITRRDILIGAGATVAAQEALARAGRVIGAGGGTASPPTVPNPAKIGTNYPVGRDYPDPPSYWLALAAEFGTTPIPFGTPYVAQQYNDSTFTLPNGLDFGVSNPVNTSLWDGTGQPAIIFTTASGQNFNPNVRSNPLRLNTANGVTWDITCSGNCNRPGSVNQGISIGTRNIAINNIQINIDGPTNVGINSEVAGYSSPAFYMNYCIVYANVSGNPGGAAIVSGEYGQYNVCLIVNFFPYNATAPNGIFIDDGNSTLNRCTVVVPSDLSTAQLQDIANEFFESSPRTTLINSVFMGATNFSGGGSAYTITNCATDQVVTGYSPPLSNIVQITPYSGQFNGVTMSGGLDYRTQSSSGLIAAGSVVGPGQIDITGALIPSSTACDIGCFQFTPAPLALTINGSSSPAPVNPNPASLNFPAYIRFTLTGVPSGTGVRVVLTDAATLTQNYHEVDINPPPATIDGQLPLTFNNSGIYDPLPAGNYAVVMFYVGSPGVPVISLPITVNAALISPSPSLNLHTWDLAIMTASPVDFGSSMSRSLVVHGTVTMGVSNWSNLNGTPHPTNVTGQITLYGDFTGSMTNQKRLIGSQVFDAGGLPSVTFNTTTIPDGAYMLGIDIVDCHDTGSGGWYAYQLLQYPRPIIVMNSGPQSPSGTYIIPCASLNVNTEIYSTTVDGVTYSGLPAYNATTPYPYPGPSLTPVVAPPVTNSAALWHSNPALARSSTWYIENSDMINMHEYRNAEEFQTTPLGGIFAGSWSGEGGDESVQITYQAMAARSWLDGPRNSHGSTGNSIGVATVDPRRTGGTGPFDSYHWTIINIGGQLAVRDLAGNMKTIAGYKRDTTKLPMDYMDASLVPEFPNTVLVGTIDTAAATNFSDFGGGPNDCCWDPQNSNICYVAQTLDQCIVACDFTTTGPYGPTNPRLYRYAGYKGGLSGEGTGGYQDGPALATYTATFTGVISGPTLTVSGVSGTISIGQYLTDNGEGNIAAGTHITGGSGSTWTITPSQTVASETMYANNGDGAQFNQIFSICMQRVSGISGQPIGTMYVADYANCLIRRIAQTSPGVAGAVTTLCGLAGGSTAPGAAPGFDGTVMASTTYAVTSITSNGDGTCTVILPSSPTTAIAGDGWKVTIQLNGSNYNTGTSQENSLYGIYTIPVGGFTSSTHFKVTMNPAPGAGTLTAIVYIADHYSAPSPGGALSAGVAFSASNCFTAYPQTIRMNSAGDIILGEAWYNMMLRRIWLSGGNVNTITRIMPFGNLASIQAPSALGGYGFFDCDDVGACGPLDDLVCFKTDANPGSAAYTSRIAIDASYEGQFYSGSDVVLPQEGNGGTGHYPWIFVWSKTQCRWLGAGKADTIFYSGRPYISGTDPNFTLFDQVCGFTGQAIFQAGSPPYAPFLGRPSFAALTGSQGTGLFGQNVVPTIDDLAVLYPNDYSPFSGSLAQFIQNGMGGKTPRPELSMDGSLPGRDLHNLIYYLRRLSLPGSWPTIFPPLFVDQPSMPFDGGSGVLATLGTYDLNFVRPTVSVTSANRVTSSSISVSWTTNVPTLGIICCGSSNSAGSPYPYNVFTTWDEDNSGTYGTSHSVTITNLPTSSPTHYVVEVKDEAGNWNVTTDATVT